jgi:hypothetical protein
MYFIYLDEVDPDHKMILKIENINNIFIPLEGSNRYYQNYLEWLSQGNTAPEVLSIDQARGMIE